MQGVDKLIEFCDISMLLIGTGGDLNLLEKLVVGVTVEGTLGEGLSCPEICETKSRVNVKDLTRTLLPYGAKTANTCLSPITERLQQLISMSSD